MRELVTGLCVDWGVSIRKACGAIRFDTSTYHYKSRHTDQAAVERRICAQVGYPKTIRVDNGSEFISRYLDLWAYANEVTLDFSRPGKPTDNGFIEAFNSKLPAECLNAHWFMSLADAREKLDAWRRDYNEVRPHSAIGYNVPIALHYPDGAASPSS
jgi:putative transposase